jgi:hypothetical protein
MINGPVGRYFHIIGSRFTGSLLEMSRKATVAERKLVTESSVDFGLMLI